MKMEILQILNNARYNLMKQMMSGNEIDYKELLFQIDEEIRKVLGD
ncbi:MAG: hypothetical protein IKI95_05950 [Clostridia bacterium]|nr:hypothetical protein [Clostridia bacterium]